MRRRENDEYTNLTIVEAVETLSSIADLDLERDIGVNQRHDAALGEKIRPYHAVHWLQQADANSTLEIIKNTFRVILRYVRSFYKEEHGYLADAQTVEGIKTIMVLVGEAAKKLDRFTKLFHGARAASVMNTKEYKALQDFYQKRIARKIDEGTLGKWVLALTAPRVPQVKARTAPPSLDMSKRVVVDLDTVKKDTEYELFFMRKDDGTRYFGPALLRNIRLVCDFGDYFSDSKGDDPLSHLEVWRDWMYQITARSIVKAMRKEADSFYRFYAKEKNQELVCCVNSMLMSVLLAANPRNLKRNRPAKSCHLYFLDFQKFLRDVLTSREYQKLVTYPPKKSHGLAWCILGLLHDICEGLYIQSAGYSEFPPLITNLIEKARRVSAVEEREGVKANWWDTLSDEYTCMLKLLKRHPNGPMYKILDMLKDEEHQCFDPLIQDNIPNRWFDLHVGERVIKNVRMAAPIRQGYIHKAVINDEFKAMLRNYQEKAGEHGNHLIINLQDRTSWLEHSRCEVLERLQDKHDFASHLRVATLAVKTDFYQQMAPYHEANHAEPFMEQLLDHLSGDASGYYFPESMLSVVTTPFLKDMLKGIHEMFFGARNILLRRDRLDFIQLAHLFLVLKVIETAKPESLSFTCKDGVDMGSAYSAMLYGALKLFNQEKILRRDIEYLSLMLFAPPLFIRERLMLPEHFQRAMGVLKVIGQTREEQGFSTFKQTLEAHFGKLYKEAMLSSEIVIPESIQVLY